MNILSIFAQLVIVVFIIICSKFIYTISKDIKKYRNIDIGNVKLNRKAIVIVLLNFIIIGIFTILYYNISKYSKIHHFYKNGKPYKISLFSAMYECFITQTTVGFGDVEYKTKLVKFITMLQMSTLFLNFGILSL